MNNKSDYIMTINRPASWWSDNWREGTPLGNGYHGALAYGAVQEKVILTHTDLWRGGKIPELPDVSHVLPEMRRLIFSGRMPEADSMINDELLRNGYDPAISYPFPAADLWITMPVREGFSRYRRELNMSTGEMKVLYYDVKKMIRRGFVSRADDVIVFETDIDSEIYITAHKTDHMISPADQEPIHSETFTDRGWIFYRADVNGQEHGAVARIIRGERILVLCKLFTSGSSSDRFAELKESLSDIPAEYDILLERHSVLHRDLFDSCRFRLSDDDPDSDNADNRCLLDRAYTDDLPNALTERMWAFGRYLMISSAAQGANPCSLIALWTGDYKVFWGINMANINLQMIYWHVLSGNIPDLMLPVFDYYENELESMRDNARKLFGCRGIYLPAVSTPGVLKHACIMPHITNWTGSAGWVGQMYYDYWLFTGDKDFLGKRAFPFLREVALFYEDFLIWQGNKWIVCPSVSPENHTSDYAETGIEHDFLMQTSINAAIDVAIIKEVFTHLLEISKILETDQNEIIKWKKILDGAPEYQYNPDGSPREWLHPDYPDRNNHRHQSHLYPVFPGLELARAGPEMLSKYEKGADNRLKYGLPDQTSWSLAQTANLYARTGASEKALKCLNIIARTTLMDNLLTVHNDWRSMGISMELPECPFQIDANMGWTAAVQEMLVFSSQEQLEILPALPGKWMKGSIGTLRTRCRILVDLNWDRTESLCHIHLKATEDRSFTLILPDKTSLLVDLVKDEEREYSCAI